MRGSAGVGERPSGLGRKPGTRRAVPLLAGPMLFCLGILLSLLATTASEAASAPTGADARHADGGLSGPLAEDGSSFLTPADDPRETDKRPVNASLMTKLVLVITSLFGASTLCLLVRNPRRRGAIRSCRGAAGVSTRLVGTHDGSSFLGVFLR
jgi:hypothetical protein